MITRPPNDAKIADLWKKQKALFDEAYKYTVAIEALQALCDHSKAVDVSRHGSPDHGSPDMECPDCGKEW